MAAPTFVASDSLAGAGTTAGIDTTGADFLAVLISGGGSTLSDSKSNTWLMLHESALSPGNGITVRLWVTVGTPTVGTGHTITFGGGFPSAFFYAFSIGGPYPDYTQNTGSVAGTVAPGSINLDVSPQLALTGVVFGGGSTVSINDSFTGLLQFPTGGPNWGGAAAYKIGNSASFNPTWTFSGSENSSTLMRIIMCDPVGGGGGGGGGSFTFLG